MAGTVFYVITNHKKVLSKEDYLKYGNLFLLQQQAELLAKYTNEVTNAN
jgi:hypothetical protein